MSLLVVGAIYELGFCKANKFPLEPALCGPCNARNHEQDRNDEHKVDLDFLDHAETRQKKEQEKHSLRPTRLNKHNVVSFDIAYHSFE
jgi:hypothetical protein